MKKLSVYLFLTFSMLLIPAVSLASFDANLKYGAKGDGVKEMQDFLIDQGLLKSSITGNFFSLTRTAVKLFQTAHSLPSTGFWGPMTRVVANQILDTDNQTSNTQEQLETGTVTPIPADRCANISGIQTTVPTGWSVNGEICFIPQSAVSLNDVVAKLNEQNRLLQGSLDLQKAEADRLRAEREAEAARLRAIADAADAEAVARYLAEETARNVAVEQLEINRLRAIEQARIDAELARQRAEAAAVAPEYDWRQVSTEANNLFYVVSSLCQPCGIVSNDFETNRNYSVIFNKRFAYARWDKGRVVFNGQTILDANSPNVVTINNLNPGQTYTYQVIFDGPDRHADSVYDGKFTVASTEPLINNTPQMSRWDNYMTKFGTDGWGFINPIY